MNENEIVAKLKKRFPRIGDDAAIVDGEVITTDMLIEDVDFTRAVALPRIARKSLAANVSDIAAMGARPAYAVVALGLPAWADIDALDALIRGFAEAAKEFAIEIVGGDLSRAEKLIISIAAVGTIETRPLLRSGARPGDRVYISRPIGGAAAGLQLLRRGFEGAGYAQRETAQSAIRRHLDPEPEVALGLALAAIDEVTACIDVSDGLSTDLHHLCDASQCGVEIERERIPVFDGLALLGVNVADAVLHGGEEYALLFTSTLREAELSERVKRPVYAIGRITGGREVLLDGKPLEAGGWDHFGVRTSRPRE